MTELIGAFLGAGLFTRLAHRLLRGRPWMTRIVFAYASITVVGGVIRILTWGKAMGDEVYRGPVAWLAAIGGPTLAFWLVYDASMMLRQPQLPPANAPVGADRRTCGRCQSPNDANAKYCNQCGRSFTGTGITFADRGVAFGVGIVTYVAALIIVGSLGFKAPPATAAPAYATATTAVEQPARTPTAPTTPAVSTVPTPTTPSPVTISEGKVKVRSPYGLPGPASRATFDVKNTGIQAVDAVRFEVRLVNPFGEAVCPVRGGYVLETPGDVCKCSNTATGYLCETQGFSLGGRGSKQIGCELPSCGLEGRALSTVRLVAFKDGSQWRSGG